jgi:hypothetical protein
MKVLIQLLKEFWLPLILGLLWTIYNIADTPIAEWSAKNFLNIFGPTFFFMSWLVAQWYRVRKQQKVEAGLGEIQDNVRSLHYPLLPCVVFITTKRKYFDNEIAYSFSECNGYKKYGEGSLLKPTGSVKLNSVCNPIEHKVEHSCCSIRDTEKLAKMGDSSVINVPLPMKIDFYFGDKKRDVPSLQLMSGHSTQSNVLGLDLYDDTVYQDTGVRGLVSKSLKDKVWNITDLKNAFIRVTFEFNSFILPGESARGKDMWPSLHNLQLVFGDNSRRILSFSIDDLSSQSVKENPNPLMQGDFSSILLIFEKQLDEKFYENQLYHIS